MKLLRIYSTSIAEFRVRKQVIRVRIDVRTCKQIGKRKCLDICIYIYVYYIIICIYNYVRKYPTNCTSSYIGFSWTFMPPLLIWQEKDIFSSVNMHNYFNTFTDILYSMSFFFQKMYFLKNSTLFNVSLVFCDCRIQKYVVERRLILLISDIVDRRVLQFVRKIPEKRRDAFRHIINAPAWRKYHYKTVQSLRNVVCVFIGKIFSRVISIVLLSVTSL